MAGDPDILLAPDLEAGNMVAKQLSFLANPLYREQLAQTRITSASGETHELDYVMRRSSGGWKAVDVLADGSISRVAVQRSDFRRLVARGGAEALIQSLNQKTSDLSGGALT